MKCPICKKEFRRGIESWMKFECSICKQDMCKETDTYLYSGECSNCFWKGFVKTLPVVVEKKVKIEKEKEIKPVIKQPNLDKWF